jgi:hypothetical protein
LSLNDWSLHGRYYETLFGVPLAYAVRLSAARSS